MSCPLAGLMGGAAPSDAQDLAEPHSCGDGSKIEMPMTCLMALLVVMTACILWKYALITHEG